MSVEVAMCTMCPDAVELKRVSYANRAHAWGDGAGQVQGREAQVDVGGV